MKRRLLAVAVGGLLLAGAVTASPAVADDDDWICVGIIPPVDKSICPGSPYGLLPDPLVPALPLG